MTGPPTSTPQEPASAPTPAPDAPDAIEREVLDNILSQLISEPAAPGDPPQTVADLNLPASYRRRVVDRVIRTSFEERNRIVIADGDAPAPQGTAPKRTAPSPRTGSATFQVIPAAGAQAGAPGWREARPPARGFRIAPGDATTCPFEPETAGNPPLRDIAQLVAHRLAFDGLLNTLAHALKLPALSGAPAYAPERLSAAGFPVDLLRHFVAPGEQGEPRGSALCQLISQRLSAGATTEQALAGVSFVPAPSAPAFQAFSESGEHELSLLRIHLTRGDYWSVPGAGEVLDLARQLLVALPESAFLLHIEAAHTASFLRSARDWVVPSPQRVRLLEHPAPITQWAQDNAKPGFDQDGPITLVPRYPSRGEDGSVFLPGDAGAVASLSAAGLRLAHSTLVFQGGNCLVVEAPFIGDASQRRRVMLLGEGELWRNTALGLSEQQALAAFSAEFGVERCIVLPAASFHVDQEVCVRSRSSSGDAIAFVNDTLAASRIILDCGLRALSEARVVAKDDCRRARAALRAGATAESLAIIGSVISRHGPLGRFTLPFASLFSVGPMDSGTGNLHRFLLAFDTLVALGPRSTMEPADLHLRAYLSSIRRREDDRAAIRQSLAGAGFRVVPVPSTSEELRGTNYLNGVHTPSRYLMPAYGGLYAPLDEAASGIFRRELGRTVKIMPVLCAESQRRAGAVHCSVSTYANTC